MFIGIAYRGNRSGVARHPVASSLLSGIPPELFLIFLILKISILVKKPKAVSKQTFTLSSNEYAVYLLPVRVEGGWND
jgi:hypothetical protein